MDLRKPILWVHEEALGPANPALQDYPNAPGLFVFDDAWIQDQSISRKRIGFLYESALSLPLTLRRGDVALEVLRFAQRHGVIYRRVQLQPMCRTPIQAEDHSIQT